MLKWETGRLPQKGAKSYENLWNPNSLSGDDRFLVRQRFYLRVQWTLRKLGGMGRGKNGAGGGNHLRGSCNSRIWRRTDTHVEWCERAAIGGDSLSPRSGDR